MGFPHAFDCPASIGPMPCSCGAERLVEAGGCAPPVIVVEATRNLVDEQFIKHARAVQKRCQIGVRKGPEAYDALHDVLADCYGTIGRLIKLAEGQELEPWSPGQFSSTRLTGS